MVFNGNTLYSMVIIGIQWYYMVFSGKHSNTCYSVVIYMVFSGKHSNTCYSVVIHGIQW